ncbi:MAG: hypothetical protein COB15_11355 [Flavobacteriales bacterium]|nr:MAG: hypothetical protein COB15_11355 [Flavobacteriales bacterium]
MGLFKGFDKVSRQDWLDKITADLKGKDFNETLVWNSKEGIDVQPFYNSDTNIQSTTPLKPFNSWKIREKITIQSIKKANQEALLALKGGANSILFIGEINSQKEMNELLSEIQTEIIEIHFYNSNPKKTSTFIKLNRGSISYDYLSEAYLSKNDSIDKNIDDLAENTSSNTNIKTITVNGVNYANNGFSLSEEIGLSLAQAVEYFNLLIDRGIKPSKIANSIQFSFGIETNYFFEIAKIRAARKLWDIILEQYQVTDTTMDIHSETTITKNSEEDNNYDILRNTTKAMSAIIGGCDSLTILPHDDSETNIGFSNRIARNIQHILKEEAFFDKVNNPADGAYYIEELTDKIASKSWTFFQEIEKKGGFLACIDKGVIKNEEDAISWLKSIDIK